MSVTPDDQHLLPLLREYSDSTTGFFHWCITRRLTEYLEPVARSEVT
jgi:hypothetical protein